MTRKGLSAKSSAFCERSHICTTSNQSPLRHYEAPNTQPRESSVMRMVAEPREAPFLAHWADLDPTSASGPEQRGTTGTSRLYTGG